MRRVTLPDKPMVPCVMKGHPGRPARGPSECGDCRGSGSVPCHFHGHPPDDRSFQKCVTCDGSGRIEGDEILIPCPDGMSDPPNPYLRPARLLSDPTEADGGWVVEVEEET